MRSRHALCRAGLQIAAKRWIVPWALLAALVITPAADAQQTVRRVKLEGIQVGFQNSPGAFADGCKTGLWAPVLVRFVDDEQGHIRLPVAVDGSVSGELLLEAPDNEFVFTVYRQPFTFGANEPLHVLSYTKIASTHTELKVTVMVGDRAYPTVTKYCQAIDIGQHVYLTLGDKLPDLLQSLLKLSGDKENPDFFNLPFHVVQENNLQRLPKLWFGYNAIDLAVLTSSNGKFIDALTGERQGSPQLEALADWVRRGGKLVVSIAPSNREKVYRLLSSPVWRPALPEVLALDSKTVELETLSDLQNWSNIRGNVPPFQRKLDKDGKPRKRTIVELPSNPAVTVWSKESTGPTNIAPLIVRFPHGLGSITLLSFDLGDPFLSEWPGRFDFWQALVQKLGPAWPRVPEGGADFQGRPRFGRNFGEFASGQDVTSRLYDELDRKFDTPTISFGWVLLFIAIYIIVVGPVDYLILKYVFKRLELTWLTFPAVVLTVSLLAYFTAYAIKGQDLKVNKVDLIDIDLRSALGSDLQPAGATAYGTSWFTILSPRIQSYTIALEPMMHNWQPGAAAPTQSVESTTSWFGRPEFSGPAATGRGRSPGLFSHSYSYEPNAVGLRGVPIPVWTTRSFTASWAAPFEKNNLPFESKLTFEASKLGSRFDFFSGTLKNNLPFDLHDVRVVYRDKYYSQPDILKGATVQLKLDAERAMNAWLSAAEVGLGAAQGWEPQRRLDNHFNPSALIRQLMFHEKTGFSDSRNHAHRDLDLSWRLTIPDGDDAQVREVVLVASVIGGKGSLEQLQAGSNLTMPTRLWLGQGPALQGTLAQETYLRVILPVAPTRAP